MSFFLLSYQKIYRLYMIIRHIQYIEIVDTYVSLFCIYMYIMDYHGNFDDNYGLMRIIPKQMIWKNCS